MYNRKKIGFIVLIIFLFGLIAPCIGAEYSKNSADERYLEKVYHSKLDSTLQPYIVKLPQNYDKQKKYPLVVYLHGSGCDEKFIFHKVNDPFCPYEMGEKSVGIFQENGAIVEFYPENTEGHGSPSPETITAYHQWLRKVIKKQKHQNNYKYPKIISK